MRRNPRCVPCGHRLPMRYHATVCTGLEFIAAAELRERLAGVDHIVQEPGRVLFDYERDPRDLFALRSVNHLHAHVAQFSGIPLGEEGLRRLEELGAALDFQPALTTLAAFDLPRSSPPLFRVTAERTGDHVYRSPMVAAALGAGIRATTGWVVNLTEFDIEVHAELVQDRLTVGLQLTRESLHRRNLVLPSRASLKPTVAYALVRLADPSPGHWLIDPMCGGGTILLEAAQTEPDVRLLGGDVDPLALTRAAVNRAGGGVCFPLFRWDARRLPLADHSMDRMVANLPFGVRVGSHRKNRALYRDLLAEFERVLSPAGIVVLLTLERRLMASLLPCYPVFTTLAQHPVNIGGLVPSAYVLRTARRQQVQRPTRRDQGPPDPGRGCVA